MSKLFTSIVVLSSTMTGEFSRVGFLGKLASNAIMKVKEKILLLSIDSKFTDFEDAIQYYAAKNQGISYLITRNKSDYKVSDITICTAEEYLKIHHHAFENQTFIPQNSTINPLTLF